MIQYHNLNGKVVEVSKAQIMVNDVGLLRGYGIFDFFPIRQGRPLFEEDYFNRFFRSAEMMRLVVPIDRAELRQRVVELAQINGITNGYTKLVLTGGDAADGYTPGLNNLYILQHADLLPEPSHYQEGIALLLQKYLKDQPEIKTLHYANALIYRGELKENKALDILYHDGRYIRETSRANFFIINHQQEIHTTEGNVLSGITRKHVLKMIRQLGLRVVEEPLPIYSITTSAECFITSTTKGVLPVSRIGDYRIGDGKAGVLSQELNKEFIKYCDQL
jgi:branched-subunit amino acid aminotransferase/4-amino-4-deoxychorismate lyase